MQSSAGGANQLQDQIREVREMCGSVKTADSNSVPQLERKSGFRSVTEVSSN